MSGIPVDHIDVAGFDSEKSDFQLVEQYSWIPSINVEYFVGVDGISVLFLPLTALLTIVGILASWNSTQHSHRFHFALMLALEGVTMGVFCALDMVLFLLFWELTLPPFFFLIGLWGIGSQRRGAAMKYTLFMLFGGVPLLLAIILLATNHASQTGALFLMTWHLVYRSCWIRTCLMNCNPLYFFCCYSALQLKRHLFHYTPGCRQYPWRDQHML